MIKIKQAIIWQRKLTEMVTSNSSSAKVPVRGN